MAILKRQLHDDFEKRGESLLYDLIILYVGKMRKIT